MTNQHSQTCGVAKMMNVFGDRWTWLLVREAFYGATRFTEFQRNTGASRNILTDRLNALVANGVFEQVDIGVRGHRVAYGLTQKGSALLPVMVAMSDWANRYEYGPGHEPVLHVDRKTDLPVDHIGFRDAEGGEIRPEDIRVLPGPGASPATVRRLAKSCLST